MADNSLSLHGNVEGGWTWRSTGVVKILDPDGKTQFIPAHSVLSNGTTIITSNASPTEQTLTLKEGNNPAEVNNVTDLTIAKAMQRVLGGDVKLSHLSPYGSIIKSSLTAFQQAYEQAKTTLATSETARSKPQKPVADKAGVHNSAAKLKVDSPARNPAQDAAHDRGTIKPVRPPHETPMADKSSAHNKYPGEFVEFGKGYGVNLTRDLHGEPVMSYGKWEVSTTRATEPEMESGPKREAALVALHAALRTATDPTAASNYRYMLDTVEALPHAAADHAVKVEHAHSLPGKPRRGNHRHHMHGGTAHPHKVHPKPKAPPNSNNCPKPIVPSGL